MASELPSQRANLINSSTEKARNYIQNKEIPQLFEALMTGLMFKQPDDHIDYIINCLQRVKQARGQGNDENNKQNGSVKWNTFLTAPNDKDLPPLKDNSQQINKEARVLSGNN